MSDTTPIRPVVGLAATPDLTREATLEARAAALADARRRVTVEVGLALVEAELAVLRASWPERVVGELVELVDPRLPLEAYDPRNCPRCRRVTHTAPRLCEGRTFLHCLACGAPTGGDWHDDARVRYGHLAPSDADRAARDLDDLLRRIITGGPLSDGERQRVSAISEAFHRREAADVERIARGGRPAPLHPGVPDVGER